MLFVALAFFVSLTIITYGIAVPSGLFIPAYVVGGESCGITQSTVSGACKPPPLTRVKLFHALVAN